MHHGRDDAVQILRLDVETFRRAAEQDGQRIARFALFLDQAGQGGFLAGDDGLLVREIQVGGHAGHHLGLDHGQDALGGVDVLAGDGDALARGAGR